MTMTKRNMSPSNAEMDDLLGDLAFPDFGNVGGEPLSIHGVFADDQIDRMGADELRAELRLLRDAYLKTLAKMVQLSHYVPPEIHSRDPGVMLGIILLLEKGYSDEEIAIEIGESVKFVQRTRLLMDRSGTYKRPRGRPRKISPNT